MSEPETTGMIQQIATVAVYVEDQNSALEFWRDRMGFEARARESMGKAGFWLEVAPKGAGSRLVLYPKALMPNWQELRPSILFECHDIQTTYESLKNRGVAFSEEPKKRAWGRYAKFRDTDGNEFLLKGS